MKSKPLPSMPGNSAILHIKTPDTNGIVSYTESSQLSKARPRSALPIWETTSHWRLGSFAEAAEEEEKPMAWAEPPEQAVTFYFVTAILSVLSLTLVTMWLKQRSHCLTLRAWQGLDEQQRKLLMGKMRGCSMGMLELPKKEYSAVMHRECGEGDKNMRGTGMAQFTR